MRPSPGATQTTSPPRRDRRPALRTRRKSRLDRRGRMAITRSSGRELGSALGPSGPQDCPPGPRSHPGPKTVLALAPAIVWLESPLRHRSSLPTENGPLIVATSLVAKSRGPTGCGPQYRRRVFFHVNGSRAAYRDFRIERGRDCWFHEPRFRGPLAGRGSWRFPPGFPGRCSEGAVDDCPHLWIKLLTEAFSLVEPIFLAAVTCRRRAFRRPHGAGAC